MVNIHSPLPSSPVFLKLQVEKPIGDVNVLGHDQHCYEKIEWNRRLEKKVRCITNNQDIFCMEGFSYICVCVHVYVFYAINIFLKMHLKS